MNLPVNLGFKVRGKKIPVNLGVKCQGQVSQTLQLKLNIPGAGTLEFVPGLKRCIITIDSVQTSKIPINQYQIYWFRGLFLMSQFSRLTPSVEKFFEDSDWTRQGTLYLAF